MSDKDTTEDTRPVPVVSSHEFGALAFKGGRYDEDRRGLPVFAMAELQRYANLVSRVARSMYMQDNPQRKRAPGAFADALDLRLTRVDTGSIIPVLERPSVDPTDFAMAAAYEVYDAARDIIDDTFREINESGRIPANFPMSAVGALAQFGKSLRDDEYIMLGSQSESRSVVNRQVREKLRELANLQGIEVERVLIGRITGLRSEPKHQFDLVLSGTDKRRPIEGMFVDPATFDLLDGFKGYAGTAPLCSVSVVTEQFANGEFDIIDVLAVEVALPPEWSNRVAELTEIRDGWLTPATAAPTAEVIDLLELLLARWFDLGIPRPLMYPSGEGGIQLEWREPRAEIEVEILNSRTVEAVWFDPDSDSGEELKFLFADIDSITRFVVRSLGNE